MVFSLSKSLAAVAVIGSLALAVGCGHKDVGPTGQSEPSPPPGEAQARAARAQAEAAQASQHGPRNTAPPPGSH